MNETIDPVRAAAALMESLSTTFADMAFIDVEPARGGRPLAEGAASGRSSGQEPIRVAIDILKPISCRLEIECPASLKDRIEATLFQGRGKDMDTGKAEGDSLLELLNVAAGVFLTSLFGPGADIKLELPQYLFLSRGSEEEILAEAAGDAEGEPIRALLRSIRYRY